MTDKKGVVTSYERLPNIEAEKAFNNKTLITSADFAHFKAYQHALAFTVAGLADQDLLADIHKAVKSAIDNGTTFNDFKKQLLPYLTDKGWLSPTLTDDKQTDKALLKEHKSTLNRRLKTIYHTNQHTAYAAGRWERIQRTKEHLPYLQYMPSVSANLRDDHKQFYGLIATVDDPIWQSIYPPNGFGCKCWVRQLTKTKAQKLLDEQAKDGVVYDIEMQEVKDPKTGDVISIPKGIAPSFNHNHDRLTALLRLAEDKHGADFAKILGIDLKQEMVGYAVKGGITHIDFRGITPRVGEVARLEKELGDNKPKPFEGALADEWQQKFGVKLERFDPNAHKVLVKDKNADYAVVDLSKDPKNWVTLDFMFAMSKDEADRMSGQILGTITSPKKKNQERYDKMWDNLQAQILLHLDKADIVPMDLRQLDPRLVVKIVAFVVSLDRELSKKIVFIKD